jgi:hypothetical protein
VSDKGPVVTVAHVTYPETLPDTPAVDDAAPARPAILPRFRAWLRPRRRWCWGTRLVLAASLGWLLFVVAHRLFSGRTWVWALLDLIPPVTFVLVPALLLAVAPFARPIRWRVMAVVVLAAMLSAGNSGVNLASLWYSPPAAPPGAMTVVSWNTEYWDQDWRTSGGQSLEPDFYRYLRDLDADVYLLKEYIHIRPVFPLELGYVFAVDRVDRLRAEFPGYHIAVAGKQITISRFPIVHYRGLDNRSWLPRDLRDVSAEFPDFPEFTTETLRTDLLVDGTVISFYNTHIFQPAIDAHLYRGETQRIHRRAFHMREASFEALRADVERNRHPVVVGGDLNASSTMGILRLLPDRLEDRRPAIASIYPTSWRVGSWLDLWQIDWLFTTQDVAVHEYDLVDPAGLSDHRVVRGLLSIQTP